MASRFISLNLSVLLCSLLIMVNSWVEEPFLHPKAAESGNAFFIISDQPTVLDQNLEVKAVASGLVTPISIVFLSANDILVQSCKFQKTFQLTNTKRVLNTGKTKMHIYS